MRPTAKGGVAVRALMFAVDALVYLSNAFVCGNDGAPGVPVFIFLICFHA
jgi:hypothetical protein